MNKNNIRKATFTALFAALVFVATAMFPIPLPAGAGYVNMGDVLVLLAASVLGGWYGAIAGGLGAALADVLLGYAAYAPVTFVVKALMALVFCVAFKLFFALRMPVVIKALISALMAETVMVLGYFIYECFIFGVAAAVGGVIANSMQGVFAVLCCALLNSVVNKFSNYVNCTKPLDTNK